MMNKFQNFLESVRSVDPVLVEGIERAYQLIMTEGLSPECNACMTEMKKLVDEHGYWSEPVKEYSLEMDGNPKLTADDKATIHSTHMNMY